ncbi:DUF6221 family protein [Nocardia sp. NPDC004260]
MTSDPLSRLRAGLAEDERDAMKAQQAAESQGGELWVVTGTDNAVGVDYDPARVLRQVEAIRKMLGRYENEMRMASIDTDPQARAYGRGYRSACRQFVDELASIYPEGGS